MAFEKELSITEIINSWNRDEDKTDSDIINFVKALGIDDPDFKKRYAREWTAKEKSQKTAPYYDRILDQYEDIMLEAQTAKGQYEKGKYQDTVKKEFWRKYPIKGGIEDKTKEGKRQKIYITKQPGKRGIPSTTAEWYAGERDRAHKELMKIKEEEKRLAEEKKGLSIWQRMGKHLGENAAARDKFFTTIGSIGRELVKPIQPGQAAAGALLPTLSRGLEAGEEAYATKQAAETKRMLDMASARQKINPMQYYSNKMNEARLMVPEGIDPDSAAGKTWIGNHLRSIGIPSQVVDIGNSITEAQLLLTTAPEDQRELIQKNINDMIIQQNTLLNQMMGGGSTDSGNVPYLGLS